MFPAPPREVLAAPDYAQACAVARRLTGRAISLQTFHITPKIAEWDAVAPARPGRRGASRARAADAGARTSDFAPKKSARGAGQRIAALARWVDPAARWATCRAGARLDDVLDALAVAWSAQRWARGAAEVLGDERDARGRPMRDRLI